jgi:hypothetical protein
MPNFRFIGNCSFVTTQHGKRDLPLGLSHDMCLVVTKEALQSQLSGSTSTSHNYANRKDAPFVIALDMEPSDAEHEEGYMGYFKVAISSLLNDFFPAMVGYQLLPEELMHSSGGGLWFAMS